MDRLLNITGISVRAVRFVVLGCLAVLPGLRAAEIISIAADQVPPRIQREFRGAWIASYSNIDWPSKPGLPAAQQKAELIAILDKAAELRLNALILQVRPACDAFYPSPIEPWSYYLTGKMGEGPGYDPLAFAVEQAHARGLELHAWFNPYRAGLLAWKNISPNHIIKRQPHLVRKYAEYYWLDPSEPAVQDYTASVILDVVRRYDIDGVHMDDYFYPYPAKDREKRLIDFPDGSTWQKYRAAGGQLERGDWRRESVNKLVQRLHGEVKREKSWVKFGISPFGIWRPGFPEQIKGLDAYAHLFADARLWLVNGWVDYMAPQLYWAIDPPAQSYTALLNWWQEQNPRNVQIWPGGSVSNIERKKWPSNEILRQVDLARGTRTPGYIYWNISTLLRNPDNLAAKLAQQRYLEPAAVPATQQAATPAKPSVTVEPNGGTGKMVKWAASPGEKIYLWVMQSKVNGKWRTEFFPAEVTSRTLGEDPKQAMPEVIALSAFSRFRMLSPAALIVP